MSLFFSKQEDAIECQYCGYKIVKPYPQDQLCPKCQKFLANLFKYEEEENIQTKPEPKEFETKATTVSSKLKGKVKVKKKTQNLTLDQDKIELQKNEYIKLIGITSVDRTPLFCSNEKFVYFLELTNNLDFIATSIMSGQLDKMLLVSEADGSEEKCQFFVKDEIIYIVYGIFPDKKGKWLLEQMANHYGGIVKGKDVNNLEKLEKYNIETKFKGIIKFILTEYQKMQEIFTDKDIPYVEDKIRVDYLGLSSKSIGVVSLLVGDKLNVEVPGTYDDPDDEREMKETILTAKIEAIAANTYGNTGALPKWIAVRLGFQQYRFLTFQKFDNHYYLSILSEGNLNKNPVLESFLEPYVSHVCDSPFQGDLKPFNRLKLSLIDVLSKKREF